MIKNNFSLKKKLILSFLIANRFYKGKNQNGIQKLTLLISKIGIILGMMIFIISFSIINGFKKELNEKILSTVGHINIECKNNSFYKFNYIKKIVKSTNNNIVEVHPYIRIYGILNSGKNIETVQINNFDFYNKKKSSYNYKYIDTNVLKKIKNNSHQVIIGVDLAKSLKIKLKNHVDLFVSNLKKKAILNI
ncbi:MAG: ABC transporter permease [Buchnera aphidicola (Tetraneura sorini)]